MIRQPLTLLVSLLLPAMTVASDVEVSESYIHYPVAAAVVDDLGPALLAASIEQGLSDSAIALTESRQHWSLQMVSARNRCSVESAEVTLEVVYTLPTLDSDDAATNARWDTLYPRIVTHEIAHKDIALETARELLAALSELSPASDCDALVAKGNIVAQRLRSAERRRQRAFDNETRDGVIEGVIEFTIAE